MLHKNSATYWVDKVERSKSALRYCQEYEDEVNIDGYHKALRKAERKLEQIRRRCGVTINSEREV